MKKILLSLLSIGAAGALAFGASQAFFSDTETSTGNVFEAGEIDLTVASVGSSNINTCRFDNADGGPIFYCEDVKPGDFGESTLTFNLTSNPAWACVAVNNLIDTDNTCPEAEVASESLCSENGDGELDNNLLLTVWIDDGAGDEGEACDNTLNGNEQVLATDKPLSDFGLANGDIVIPVADNSLQSLLGTGVALQSGEYCLGVAWKIPESTGNEVQTDMLGGDLVFYVEQERNNPTFTCDAYFAPVEGQQTLTLEDEIINPTGPWTVKVNDIFGTLSWNGDGPTFDYTFSAQGLQAGAVYNLIYYADPYPGNFPGKFIAQFTADGSGDILATSDNIDLGMDLPDPADANFGTGAKIWLVLASDYNGGSATTGPMTAWNPDSYLFEGNVYIQYNDTDN